MRAGLSDRRVDPRSRLSRRYPYGFCPSVEAWSLFGGAGKGFKGQARGPDYKGLLRYEEVDRWNPILVSEHPYDLELCDLCVRQCPIEIRIAQCAKEASQEKTEVARVAQRVGNECPPKHAIKLEPIEGDDGVTRMQPVILEGCVGCGVCEMICPVEPTAIVIDLDKTADTLAQGEGR